MEVFSVFATLSLVDMLSHPLDRINQSMKGVNVATAGLGERMGNLAVAMGPAALAAGLLVGAFGMAASKAMDFESAMADVAKVVNFETQAELQEMNKTVMDMAGRIPMAADGIAAIIAAAGQSGVAKQDLAEFAEQAAKMGVAFDLTGDQAGKMMSDWRAGMNLALPQVYALADAVNYLSNNMNATAPALGEVIQRVGAAAMSCGLAETQVAALGAAFLSAGASPEIAATALKSFTTTLVKGTAMSKNQAAAFASIGMSATQMAKDMQTDAQGTIFKVLQAIADKPKELQMSLLTEMFGQESIGAIAPLLQNMGNLSQAFELVGDKGNYAGSMQAEFDARSKTTQNALKLLSNKLTNLAIVVGNVFLPVITAGANALGMVADALRWVAETRFGQWLLAAAGGLAAAVLAVTGFSAGLWAVSKAAPFVSKTLLAIKTALLGLGWPVWALIAAAALLYAAWKKDFGGIATTLSRWGRNISLVVQGVTAVFGSLKGGVGEIRGELAKDIQAAGLVGIVTTVARVAYRIKEFFAGIWDGLNFDGAVVVLTPAILKIGELFNAVGRLVGSVFGMEVKGAASEARSLGQIVGGVLSWGLEMVATVIANVVRGVETLSVMFVGVAALFRGDFATATEAGRVIWENFCASLMSFADLFRIGDWIRDAWTKATEWLSSIDLFESGARLLDTFKEGILSKVESLKQTFSDALSNLRNLLPFSDAKEGPLSTLTLSGTRLMSTLGEGMNAGFPGLYNTLSSKLGSLKESLGSWWDGLWGDNDAPTPANGQAPIPVSLNGPLSLLDEGVNMNFSNLYNPLFSKLGSARESIDSWWDALWSDGDAAVPAPSPAIPAAPGAPEDVAEEQDRRARAAGDQAAAPQSWTLNIANITLPNVKDAQDFYTDLQAAATEMGESMA